MKLAQDRTTVGFGRRKNKQREQQKENKLLLLSWGWNNIFMAILGIIGLSTVAPLVLMIIISFSTKASLQHKGYSFFPEGFTLDAYKYLFQTGDQIINSYVITIFYAVVGTVLTLLFTSTMAYVVFQKDFPYRKFLTWFMFIPMLFSGGLIPSYILNTRYLHLQNTIWIFLLSGLVGCWGVIILRTFMKSAIPDGLIEAARIDGAGHFRIFFSIVTPLLKAGLATLGLFTLVGRWGDWFTGLLYIDSSKARLIPLQTMLWNLEANLDFMKNSSHVARSPEMIAMMKGLPEQSVRMSCTVVVILPILFAYPFFQRYFVQGMVVGSIKE